VGGHVCVIGGGVIGSSVALALARRDVDVTLLEAEAELCLAASATNSGILHTGFDSLPGKLETEMIVRAGRLRDELLDGLGIPVLRTGALLRPSDERERAAVVELAAGAQANGIAVELAGDGSLVVPGESVTDPVAYTLAVAAAAERAGARIATGAWIDGIRSDGDELVLTSDGQMVARGAAVVNCAGLHADDVARAVGDERFRIFPRKGEFFVFDPPAGLELSHVLLPVPSVKTKGVLVFPTTDGKIVAGPTAHDQEDKRDWSVRPGALDAVRAGAARLLPELEQLEPLASYAGLRPAGDGVNYVIERSPACPRLVHAAAIRSTGLSSSPAVAERLCGLIEEIGVRMGAQQPLRRGEPAQRAGPWWRRAAEHWAVAAR
jgi:glycerol-3-phosphate dehydrogenase